MKISSHEILAWRCEDGWCIELNPITFNTRITIYQITLRQWTENDRYCVLLFYDVEVEITAFTSGMAGESSLGKQFFCEIHRIASDKCARGISLVQLPRTRKNFRTSYTTQFIKISTHLLCMSRASRVLFGNWPCQASLTYAPGKGWR